MPAPVPARITYGDPSSLLQLAAAVGAAQRRSTPSYVPRVAASSINDPIQISAPSAPVGAPATSAYVVRNPLGAEIAAANERHKAALAALQNAQTGGASVTTFGSGTGAPDGGRGTVTVTRQFPEAATPLSQSKAEYIRQRGLDPQQFQNIITNPSIDFKTTVDMIEGAVPKPGAGQGNLSDVQKATLQNLTRQMQDASSRAQQAERNLRQVRPTFDPSLGPQQFTTPAQNNFDLGTGWRDRPAVTDQASLALFQSLVEARKQQQQLQEQINQMLQQGGDTGGVGAASPEQELINAMRALQ